MNDVHNEVMQNANIMPLPLLLQDVVFRQQVERETEDGCIDVCMLLPFLGSTESNGIL